MVVALTGTEALWSLMGLLCLGVIYLAIAVSKLREKVARMEGRLNGKGRY